MLPDTILDFVLIPVTIFVFALFIHDMEEWDKMKKEVSNVVANAFYTTAFVLAILNFFILGMGVMISTTGGHAIGLIFDFFIMVFTCLGVVGLVVSEYWKRKLSEMDKPVE